ncbi:MAG: 16S rRNA (cytidine(1402)-2'-O)-methyltransferase [Cyanobacteria bacterium J06560_2]
MTESVASSESSQAVEPGTLYLVGTPIGNLEDMTFRAVRVLKQANVIAAEDTRHTGRLLQHFQITTPQISYHDHNTQQRIPQLIAKLESGEAIALVTDAGMPGISDPGYELACACVEANITVVPVPGPSAVIAAVAAAGLPCDRFTFEGFLPAKGKSRKARITALKEEERTAVFYESPHRILKTLTELEAALGAERKVAIARELTKRYEEFWRGTVGDAIAHYTTTLPKGEFTLLISPCAPLDLALSTEDINRELKNLLAKGQSRTEASRNLAQRSNLSKREIYQMSLEIDIYSVLQDKSTAASEADLPLD